MMTADLGTVHESVIWTSCCKGPFGFIGGD